MNFLHSICLLPALLLLVLLCPCAVSAAQGGETNETVESLMDGILKELELSEVDEFTGQELPDRLTFSSLTAAMAEGGLDLRLIADYLLDLFFYEIAAAKPMFIQILCVSLLFSLFGRVLITGQRYVGGLGFFAVYAAVMTLLMDSFLLVHDVVESGIEKMLSFMTAFVPAYAAALLFSGNASSAGVFYELAFVLIYLLELVISTVFLPGVHIFVLLVMMDNLFEEARLSKLADLIESGIRAALKLSLAAIVGLGVVQSLLAPAKDRLLANGVFQTLQAMPGLGNTFGAAGELLVGCGIMIKNSVGTAALILLVVLAASPAVEVACFLVMYRMTGAILQPFSDRRIAECVHGVGRGCALYLKIVVDVMLLLFITISIISVSTSFIY